MPVDTSYCPCCEEIVDCECLDECLRGDSDHECFYCQETLDDDVDDQEEGGEK